MKRIIILSLLAIFAITSCKNDTAKSEKSQRFQKVTTRDVSITPENAYNDIFIDTSEVTNFLLTDSADADLTDRIRSFYNQRNYEFAWFASDGLTEQAKSFWNLVTYQKDTSLSDKGLSKKMRALFQDDSTGINPKDNSIIKTELMLTEYFMQAMLKNYDKGTFKRKDLENIIPRTKGDVIALADSFSRKKGTNTEYEDANVSYKNLKNQLPRFLEIVKKGGWQTIVANKKLYKIKDTGVVIGAIKKRLMITGELANTDTSLVFDEALVEAVKIYQTRVGIKPDGTVSQKLIELLNIPAQKRLSQILINLDRMRWLQKLKVVI